MNNQLKGVLIGVFALLIALLLMSKCSSCRQQELADVPEEQEQTPIFDDPEYTPEPDTIALEPQETIVLEPQDTIAEPEPEPEPEPEVRTDVGQDGEIRVTIEWAFKGDVDLHVTEPSGNEIYFLNMYNAQSGGRLDVDNREGGTASSSAVENIFWSTPRVGNYVVDIVMYRIDSSAPRGGYVNVRIKNGSDVRTYRAHLTSAGERLRISTFYYNGAQ